MHPDGSARTESSLIEVLQESQRLGFLGARPIDEVVGHARYFVEAVEPWLVEPGARALDLGAGGGVPGLVIAHDLPSCEVTLLDRRRTRTDFLARVVHRLEWSDRVGVLTQDAARPSDAQLNSFAVVVARGFGPPTTTLALAVRWLQPGGAVVISEPPERDRWAGVDLVEFGVSRVPSDGHVAMFRHDTA